MKNRHHCCNHQEDCRYNKCSHHHCVERGCCLLEALGKICVCQPHCHEKPNKKRFQKGSMAVGNGYHEIKVKTRREPREVYISTHTLNSQVCGGEVDVAGVKIMPDGFVLYADIRSSECKVKWVAKF